MTDTRPVADDEVAEWLPKPGEIIAGKYEVESVIGEGGMGVVVAARHEELGHTVAIKFLRSNVIDDRLVVERFLREARAVVTMHTEHVARVIDVGTHSGGEPYMIMEYLEGRDLLDVIEQDGALPVPEAVDYVLQACEAVAEAHARSLVHRDLKPANLFVTERPDGSALVKVLDFGIAKAIHEVHGTGATMLTATGTALGTPVYMSPEQVRDAGDVDARTDIWSLGTVLYQLLSGEPPFEADTVPSLCAKIIEERPPALHEQRGDVPEGLAAIVARCLEKDRGARYQSVAKLALDLGRFAPDRSLVSIERIVGISTREPSVPPTGRRLSARHMADTEVATPFDTDDDSGDDGQAEPAPGAVTGEEQADTPDSARLLTTVPSTRMLHRHRRFTPLMLAASIVVLGVAIAAIFLWRDREPPLDGRAATSKPASSPMQGTTARPALPAHRGSTAPTLPARSSDAQPPTAQPAPTAAPTSRPKPTASASNAPPPATSRPPTVPPPPNPTGEALDPLEHRR